MEIQAPDILEPYLQEISALRKELQQALKDKEKYYEHNCSNYNNC